MNNSFTEIKNKINAVVFNNWQSNELAKGCILQLYTLYQSYRRTNVSENNFLYSELDIDDIIRGISNYKGRTDETRNRSAQEAFYKWIGKATEVAREFESAVDKGWIEKK